MRAPSALTFGEAARLWLQGVRSGTVRNRSGDRYKPSTIRSYELALDGPKHDKGGLMRELGQIRLSDVSLDDVQSYADRLLAGGAAASTIRNAIMPVRVIYRWRQREVPVNPTTGLNLPAVRNGHVRIASPRRRSSSSRCCLPAIERSGRPRLRRAAPRRADGTALARRRPRPRRDRGPTSVGPEGASNGRAEVRRREPAASRSPLHSAPCSRRAALPHRPNADGLVFGRSTDAVQRHPRHPNAPDARVADGGLSQSACTTAATRSRA